MKKSPVNKKTKKKVVTTSNTAAEKKKSVKVYRKDGTLKSETTSRRGNAGYDKKGVYKGSTKKETRYTGSPRTLKTKAVEVDVKDPSTKSYTKYKKDGTVKKQLKSESTSGKNKDAKKIARKGRRDARGAETVKDVKIKRSPAKMKGDPKKKKKSETYSNYKDFKGNMQKSTIDDSTFTSDSTKFKAGINPKYKLNMNMSYDYNKKNNPKAVEFTERMSPFKITGKAYDNKEAYNKNLSASARLHYLENERADDKSPMSMNKKSPLNMYGNKSPLEKELVGKQNNLPPELKAKIEASPAKMSGKKESPMNMSRDLSYGGPVIDQEPKALSHMGASKVLRHMKGSSHSPLNMNGPGKPKQKAMKSDTVRGFDKYKVGDMVSEDDFESKFKRKGNNPKNYPQLSVQDYSNVQKDKKGKYVVKRND